MAKVVLIVFKFRSYKGFPYVCQSCKKFGQLWPPSSFLKNWLTASRTMTTLAGGKALPATRVVA